MKTSDVSKSVKSYWRKPLVLDPGYIEGYNELEHGAKNLSNTLLPSIDDLTASKTDEDNDDVDDDVWLTE